MGFYCDLRMVLTESDLVFCHPFYKFCLWPHILFWLLSQYGKIKAHPFFILCTSVYTELLLLFSCKNWRDILNTTVNVKLVNYDSRTKEGKYLQQLNGQHQSPRVFTGTHSFACFHKCVPADGLVCVVCGVSWCLHIFLWGLCSHHSHWFLLLSSLHSSYRNSNFTFILTWLMVVLFLGYSCQMMSFSVKNCHSNCSYFYWNQAHDGLSPFLGCLD